MGTPIPTIARQQIVTPTPWVDVSLETPAAQAQALANILAENDYANPVPYTATPPYGEPTPLNEYIDPGDMQSQYLIAPDVEAQALYDMANSMSHAYGPAIPETEYYNDPQYHGLGVPPGVPNYGQ